MMGEPKTGVPSYTQPFLSIVKIGPPKLEVPLYASADIGSLPTLILTEAPPNRAVATRPNKPTSAVRMPASTVSVQIGPVMIAWIPVTGSSLRDQQTHHQIQCSRLPPSHISY